MARIQRVVKEREIRGCVDGASNREKGWSQAGRSSGVSCEKAPSVRGSEAPLPRQT